MNQAVAREQTLIARAYLLILLFALMGPVFEIVGLKEGWLGFLPTLGIGAIVTLVSYRYFVFSKQLGVTVGRRLIGLAVVGLFGAYSYFGSVLGSDIYFYQGFGLGVALVLGVGLTYRLGSYLTAKILTNQKLT